MMQPQSSPDFSVATTSSSSAASTPDSHVSLKRRSPTNNLDLEFQGVRRLKYSPKTSPSSSPRTRSPLKGRQLFSKPHKTAATLLALAGASLFGSLSVLYVSFDPRSIDASVKRNSEREGGLWPLNPPRRIFYMQDSIFKPMHNRTLADDPTLHAPPGEEASEQDHMKAEHHDPDCVPMAKWQTQSFPNCNVLHEMDLRRAADETDADMSSLKLLGTGWFRSTWKWDTIGDTSVALKTLRLDREFYDEYYDLHRRDAVAMERLTHSPFVMNIYGFCGQSALNELADFQWDSLEKFDRTMRGRDGADVNFLKLQLAASVSVGLAHVHELDDQPSMVHYDINPRNIAIIAGGRPKLNDFNIAEFLRYNPKTNQTCGFRSRLHEPWWRAPEEVTIGNKNLLDASVDVYALGNLLFHILTTHSPRGKMQKARMEEVRKVVVKGIRPKMPEEFAESKDPAIVVIREAINLCYEPDPKKRPTSRKVASMLMKALSELRPNVRKIKI